MGKIFVGQTALTMEVETGADLTLATAHVIKYKKPSGALGSFTATVVDTKGGIIQHVFTSGELDEAGEWVFWAYITFTANNVSGEAFKLEIFNEGEQ